MVKCRLCYSVRIKPLIDLGRMPLAGDFPKRRIKLKTYPLKLFQCQSCLSIQLEKAVNPDKLFHSYYSSIALSSHFQELAKKLCKRFIKSNSLVVEIGSNDGVLLEPIKQLSGAKVIGIDPRRKIVQRAFDKGISTYTEYFTQLTGEKIVLDYGFADLVLANNVFAHIEDLHEVMAGITAVLKRTGVFIFEVHYLPDMQYENIYHEHIYYHTITSLISFLALYDMQIFDVEKIPTHGGSIRVYVQFRFRGRRKIRQQTVDGFLKRERNFDIKEFIERTKRQKKDLLNVLKKIKSKKRTIVGYGASGKANTILNYCGIDNSLIKYIIDESPARYNRFTPGTNIPIYPPSKLGKPDYILILAWNYERQIRAKLADFKGLFIIPMPEVKLIWS